MENAGNYMDAATQFIKNIGPDILAAIAVLVIGLWLIKLFVKAFMRAMDRSNLDVSLQKFLGSLVKILLQVLLWISVASMLGIATTSFVAILGAAARIRRES